MAKKSSELFYVEGGKRKDAALHDEILAGGDHEAALAVSVKWMRAAGFSAEEITALTEDQEKKR